MKERTDISLRNVLKSLSRSLTARSKNHVCQDHVLKSGQLPFHVPAAGDFAILDVGEDATALRPAAFGSGLPKVIPDAGRPVRAAQYAFYFCLLHADLDLLEVFKSQVFRNDGVVEFGHH